MRSPDLVTRKPSVLGRSEETIGEKLGSLQMKGD